MRAQTLAFIAALAVVTVLMAGGALARTVVIGEDHAADLGAALNRALQEAPAMLLPDATLVAVEGSLLRRLVPNATARVASKSVVGLTPGEYGLVVTGVAADGSEIAIGESLRLTVAAGQVLEIALPPAADPIATYSVYAGRPGTETIQVQEALPGTIVRLTDPAEFFLRRRHEVPYYPNGPGPPVLLRVAVAAYEGERLRKLGAVQQVLVGLGQGLRVSLPTERGFTYAIFAATGTAGERRLVGGLSPGSSHLLSEMSPPRDAPPLPSRALRVEIEAGDYTQARAIVVDRPEVTIACRAPVTIRVRHGFDQAAVMINPSILGSHASDNVGVHRLHDVVIEGCTWDMSGQIETATAPVPDDARNFAVMAWATDRLTLRGLRVRNNLRGGLSALSCSDVRMEGNSIERNRGRAQSDEEGRLLPGRGVGNAINIARNAPFSDPVGDERQTRSVVVNNIVMGDDYGEMYGIVVGAGGATENTISGNTISRVRGACIALEGQNERDSGRTTISGNTCHRTGGIISDDANGSHGDTEMRAVSITGNTITDSRAAGLAVSSSNTTVVGNVIDGCHLDSTASGCILITPPRPPAGTVRRGTRNLLVGSNVISVGRESRAQPPAGIYVNGAVPIAHLLLLDNRIDCERTPASTGVQISGDVTDVILRGSSISDCGGDGVVITDFSMPGSKVPQRLLAEANVFRNLNLSQRWVDGRHPVGAAFRFLIDGPGNASAGHRLRDNRATDEQNPSRLRYGVVLDCERPGAIREVRLERNEWNARIEDVYKGGAADVVER
jgi:hypothetical protein